MALDYAQLRDSEADQALRRRRSLVILTPLVDVVFILLVFFMLASSYSEQRVISMLSPARAQQAAASGFPNAALIRIHRDGSMDLSGEPVTPVELAEKVGGRAVSREEFRYLIQPDRGVTLQQVVSVIDLLKSSGATRVSLTRKPGI